MFFMFIYKSDYFAEFYITSDVTVSSIVVILNICRMMYKSVIVVYKMSACRISCL